MSYHTFLLLIFTILAIGLYQVKSSSRIDPLVLINVGLIRGVKAANGDYSKFLGIPYGRVQDDNHFGPSLPYPPFEEVFSAHDDTSICPQMEGGHVIGDIDCLHLNVYVPHNASSTKRLPVLVFLHGGGFVNGDKRATLYGPKFLVRHDVILVVINYRLAAYGFMCLDDPRAPGNQGLKDQLLALRWVKRNIEAFGGDAGKITLSGESAGALSTDIHSLTNQEALFGRAIKQSGTALFSWAMPEPDREAPFKIAEALGFEGGNTEETLSFLSSLSSTDVIGKAEEMGIRFSLCVENKFEDVEIIINTAPINMNVENAKNIPVLIGTNDDEGTFTYRNKDMKDVMVGHIFRQRLEATFRFDEDELNALADIVRRYYIGDEEITDQVRTSIIDFESDFLYNHPTQRSIEKYVEYGTKIFYYMFSYVGHRNYMRQLYGLTGGASHADELGYLFDIDLFSEVDKDDQLIIDRMTTLWTNFAKFGDPTPETSGLLPHKWTPITEGRMDYLTLDSELQVKNRPLKERMAFWDLFYHTYAKKQKGYGEIA